MPLMKFLHPQLNYLFACGQDLVRLSSLPRRVCPARTAAGGYLRQNFSTGNCEDELPSYVRKLSLDDYFIEKVTGSYAIKTIYRHCDHAA